VAIERAPEPDDILWENSQLSMKDSIITKTKYNLITVLIVCVSGVLLFLIAFATKKMSQSLELIMNILFAVLVCVLNFVL
jgi:Ca2+/Na+ antiporter